MAVGRYTEEQKVSLVKDFASSNLNFAEFCKQQGVSKSSLYRWRQRYSNGAFVRLKATKDTPVAISSHHPKAKLCIGDNIAIEIDAGFDIDYLGALVGKVRCYDFI